MQAHQSKTPACSSYIPLVRARQQHSSGSARRCIRSPAGPRMRVRAPARSCAEFPSLAIPGLRLSLAGSLELEPDSGIKQSSSQSITAGTTRALAEPFARRVAPQMLPRRIVKVRPLPHPSTAPPAPSLVIRAGACANARSCVCRRRIRWRRIRVRPAPPDPPAPRTLRRAPAPRPRARPRFISGPECARSSSRERRGVPRGERLGAGGGQEEGALPRADTRRVPVRSAGDHGCAHRGERAALPGHHLGAGTVAL